VKASEERRAPDRVPKGEGWRRGVGKKGTPIYQTALPGGVKDDDQSAL